MHGTTMLLLPHCASKANNAYFRGLLYGVNKKLCLKSQHKDCPITSVKNMSDFCPCRKVTNLRYLLNKEGTI